MAADPITCAAGCKRAVDDEKAASDAGWELLPITQRWRCANCTHELRDINEGRPAPATSNEH